MKSFKQNDSNSFLLRNLNNYKNEKKKKAAYKISRDYKTEVINHTTLTSLKIVKANAN